MLLPLASLPDEEMCQEAAKDKLIGRNIDQVQLFMKAYWPVYDEISLPGKAATEHTRHLWIHQTLKIERNPQFARYSCLT